MKAIETEYKGYLFRSRLEARWAIFMDELGIEWLYEDEGFILSNGTWYLPDFYLPTFNGGTFVEVKPKFKQEEIEKCRDLCFDSFKCVWMAEGVPDMVGYVYLVRNEDNGVTYYVGIPNADWAQGEDRMYAEPGYINILDNKIDTEFYPSVGEKYISAVSKARKARFEHR